MYELIMTASTDLPPLDGGMVVNDVLRDLLNTLATDACDWVSVMQSFMAQPLLNFNAILCVLHVYH
jgi:hypothetical protein